ncbi:MAG: sterol desaturase family protein [Rhodocyclaceae bacterium]|nr:sterol desaturase family protein [Rhodocyclaceae bacterium]
MNPIVYAIPVFLVTILLEAWAARRRPGSYDIPDALTSLHFGVLSQVSGAFLKGLNVGLYAAAYGAFHLFDLPAGDPWVWILGLLLYDFAYYWVHRFGHEWPLFWGSHENHHSSEYFNLSTALRQTPIALWSWMFYLPLAVLGIPPLVFVVVALVDLLYQYWVHTELIGRLGWADRVFVTPSNHRVHHGQNAYCIDRNYGGILILWDRLFGTFAEERMEEPVVYGVRKAVARWEPLAAVFRVYGWLLRRLRETPGWRNRLAILFRWSAADPEWARREALISESLARFRRFSTGTPAAIRIYGGFQFALGTLLIVHFLAVFPGLEAGGAAAYALVIAGWTWSVGRLLEGVRGARAVEVARVLAMAAALQVLPHWFGTVLPMAAAALLSLAFAGSGLVLLRLPAATAFR